MIGGRHALISVALQAKRERLQRVDPRRRAELRLAVGRELADVLGEERDPLLDLGAREVRADAVVDAGAERQRACSARSAVMSNASGCIALPVGVPRGDEDDRSGREGDAAVLDLLGRGSAR